MSAASIGAILDSLSMEHAVIVDGISRVRTAIQTPRTCARPEVAQLCTMLKQHFFREDLELYPMLMSAFRRLEQAQKRVHIFEDAEEKLYREKLGTGREVTNYWNSDYDDRDIKSELVSFAKITLQVFSVLDACLDKKSAWCAEQDARVMGITHSLEARIEYEETELFPKVRRLF
ncbi:MAG: hemerythrin domain-containing protein [Magnetococcus sp. DMHC-8]